MAHRNDGPLDVRQVSQEHFARLHRAALVLCGNPWDADDLAQETFLILARQAHRFDGRSSIYTYLYGILLNLERRLRRRRGTWRRKLTVLWSRTPATGPETPSSDAPLEVREWKRSLWSEVDKLPDGQRLAMVLRFSERLPYEEIAQLLGCPVGTVKSRLHNGLATLRERLAIGDQAALLDVPQHPNQDAATG